jgi:putative transposase
VPYKEEARQALWKSFRMAQALDAGVTWAADFQFHQSEDKRVIKLLNIVCKYDQRWLTSRAARYIDALRVTATLDSLVAENGAPVYLCVDHGPEFIAGLLADWCAAMGVELHFTEPGSLRQKGVVEALNGRVRDEHLNGKLFLDATEAQAIFDHLRVDDNANRRHISLGYLTPAEFREPGTIEQLQVLAGAAKYKGWAPPQLRAA